MSLIVHHNRPFQDSDSLPPTQVATQNQGSEGTLEVSDGEDTLPISQGSGEKLPPTSPKESRIKRTFAKYVSPGRESVDKQLKEQGVTTPVRNEIRQWQRFGFPDDARHFPSTATTREVFASPN